MNNVKSDGTEGDLNTHMINEDDEYTLKGRTVREGNKMKSSGPQFMSLSRNRGLHQKTRIETF